MAQKKLNLNIEEIKRLYIEELKNITEIGKIFNCGGSTIGIFLQKNNLRMNQKERKRLLFSKGKLKSPYLGKFKNDRTEKIFCKCGCGQELFKYNPKSGVEREYIDGHNTKGKFKYDYNLKVPCACGCGTLINKFSKSSGGRENKWIKGHYNKIPLSEKNKIVECACGCGKEIWKWDKNSKERKYALGHHKISEKIRERCKTLAKNKIGKTYKELYGDKAIKMLEKRAKQILPIKDTSIEVKVQEFLKQLGIEFYTHQYMKIEHGYQCDIFIPIQPSILQKTIIECDGDFIHCNPNKYQENYVRFPKREKLTAKNIWERDKIRTEELIDKGFRVIRLWESEIKIMNLNKFEEKVKNVIIG